MQKKETNLLDALSQSLGNFRRTTLPASIADAEWRYESIVAYLSQIDRKLERVLDPRLNEENTPSTQEQVLHVLRLLAPQKVVGHAKTRVGNPGDGGYVQLEDYRNISHALSFGINDDDSWDVALAKAGVPVDQFDYSIEMAPSVHPLLTFHRKKISNIASPETATLPDLIRVFSKRDEADIILKIDIEGAEWDVFSNADDATLGKITQILCEFHDLTQLKNEAFAKCALIALQNLSRHFAPIHVHGNNNGQFSIVANVPIPDVLEVSFVSRARYALEPCNETFPTPLDAPNNPNFPDIALGQFHY